MATAFAAGHSLWGLHPAGYHFLSILFHALNSILLYVILKKLIENESISLASALLFAAHPVQTESVASASALGILLGMFFALMACWSYLKLKIWVWSLRYELNVSISHL